MKALIDTNVIIDALEKRNSFVEDCELVLMHSAINTVNMHICVNQLSDIYYIVRKYTHSNEKSYNIINKLITLFEPIDVLNIDCICAMNSEINDFEDAILENVALRADCDYIVTSNIKDFKKSKIKAIHPYDFIRLIEA